MTSARPTVKKTTYVAAQRYARDVFDHELVLTDEDVKHFIAAKGGGSTNINFDLYMASSAVGDFIRLQDYGRWALLGASILLQWGSDLLTYRDRVVTDAKGNRERRPLTWEEVQATSEWMEREDPLDPDEQQLLDAWFALTPYRVWMMVETTIEWATDILRENAFTMAAGGGDNGNPIAQAMVGHFEKVVREWGSQ